MPSFRVVFDDDHKNYGDDNDQWNEVVTDIGIAVRRGHNSGVVTDRAGERIGTWTFR